MTIDFQQLRLDGIYQMNKQEDLMLRVKIPAGIISCEQAEKIATIAERYGRSQLHLTSRASIEFHWLRHEQLAQIMPMLAAVGLTSRGACGGAVRGISCSSSFGPGFEKVQSLTRNLHRHFFGNPHFEGLPKKFKLAVETGYERARHLIQDLAIVYTGAVDGSARFDVWCAGGLGRAPQPAFCYARDLVEEELLPLAEAMVRVYARNAPAGKRLKYLLNEIGEQQFRELVEQRRNHAPAPQLRASVSGALVSESANLVTLPVFAGEISAAELRSVARLAAHFCNGYFALSVDQDVVFPLADPEQQGALESSLREQGLLSETPPLSCRVCPGNHECGMGLAATRDLARALDEQFASGALATASFAISGCSNSCSQPQLADYGIIPRKLVKEDDGSRSPRFDLLQRRGDAFGETIAEGLSRAELFSALHDLNH